MNKKHIFRKKTPEMFAGSKKSRTFAPVKRKGPGYVAQLNRASDYGSEGYRFESCRNHFQKFSIIRDGSVAQLNRASDYGSEGYRFESCRSHHY